jgi:hypothetical protein
MAGIVHPGKKRPEGAKSAAFIGKAGFTRY